MNFTLVHTFAKATQTALRLHSAGRTGLLGRDDFVQLLKLESQGWKIYRNSAGETRALSPQGDTIKINRDEGDITIRGPQKEVF